MINKTSHTIEAFRFQNQLPLSNCYDETYKPRNSNEIIFYKNSPVCSSKPFHVFEFGMPPPSFICSKKLKA